MDRVNHDGDGQHGRRSKAQACGGTPERGPPAPPRRRLENFIRNERDALRDLFVPHREQRGFSDAQPVEFFPARLACFDVGFHQALLRVSQLLQEVIPQIEWRTTHDKPLALTGASSSFSSSSAVYRRDLIVDTGQARISAISSNLKPW